MLEGSRLAWRAFAQRGLNAALHRLHPLQRGARLSRAAAPRCRKGRAPAGRDAGGSASTACLTPQAAPAAAPPPSPDAVLLPLLLLLSMRVLLVDGTGVLHPRRCGSASHLGVLSGLPTGRLLVCPPA